MKNPRDARCEYSCSWTRRAASHKYPTKVAESTQLLENVCDVVDPNVEDVQYH